MNDLIDQLEQLVDSGSERVKSMFAELRAAVPRPMTLVFVYDEQYDSYICNTQIGRYRYFEGNTARFAGTVNFVHFEAATVREMIDAMQQHFNAAWSAMTEGTP